MNDKSFIYFLLDVIIDIRGRTMRKNKFKKLLVSLVIVFFISVGFCPVINGANISLDNKYLENNNHNTSPVTFYTFDKNGIKQKDASLEKYIAEDFYKKFEELRINFILNPFDEKTEILQLEFIELLDLYDLIPADLSKQDLISLLNPSWKNILEKLLMLSKRNTDYSCSLIDSYRNNEKTTEEYSTVEYVLLSNVASYGNGIPFPLFMLPRPRGFAAWVSENSITFIGSLIQSKNFVASGEQQALALGFAGFGISGFFGQFFYALIGYAGLLIINAEEIN